MSCNKSEHPSQQVNKVIDWLSIQEQLELFDEFKTQTDAETQTSSEGLTLEGFQKFLSSTLYEYLNSVIQPTTTTTTSRLHFVSSQEQQLFQHFDSNKDNRLDRDEFSRMCQLWLHKIYNRKSALVVVDVQNDFIDGSLALIKSPAEQDGAEVVPVINKLLEANVFDQVVYTQDWHPSDHIGFHDNLHLRKFTLKTSTKNTDESKESDATSATDAVNNNNNNNNTNETRKKTISAVKVFDTVLFDEGRMEQILWPRHCVQKSWGAELHPELKVQHNSIRILKGTLSHVDAYSAFWDNMRLNETDLREELTSRGVTDVFFCGLAYDYCVAASALDSRRANFMTYVIEDACRGICRDSIQKKTSEMIENHVSVVKAGLASEYLKSTRNGRAQVNGDTDRAARVDGSDAPSDRIRDMLMNVCYMKAFVHMASS